MAANNLFWQESVANLGISGVFTGPSRYCGVPSGAASAYAAFNAYAFADTAGTLRIEVSFDQTVWRRVTADQAVAAGAALILSVPVVAPYYRVVHTNGAGAQTAFMLSTSFTAS